MKCYLKLLEFLDNGHTKNNGICLHFTMMYLINNFLAVIFTLNLKDITFCLTIY